MEALATGYGLIEGPVWQTGAGLYYSDVTNGGVYRLSPSGEISLVLPHRKGIGGIALHEAGGLVVTGRNVSFKSLRDDGAAVLLDNDVTPDAIGFNDLTTDAVGRIYVGSLAFHVVAGAPPKPGHLHMIDLDGSVRTLSDGVVVTNGLAFSPDGSRLYHCDSHEQVIRVYDVRADGSVGTWRAFARFNGDTPDGMCVAADGSVWVALAHAGAIGVFEADGSPRMRLPVPLPMVTNLCFGGDDLRDLYVVTGSERGPKANCGTIFRMRADVPGRLRPPARVALARAARK